jgi:hypothetical protein
MLKIAAMFLSAAYTGLLGRPDLFAWRPTGEIIQVTNLGRIFDVRSGRQRPFIPKGSDICGDDWKVGTAQQLTHALGLVPTAEAS